jgi:thiamine-monophosphate kinase
MAFDELSIIDRYLRPLAGEGSFHLMDDAARLDVPADADLVVTADMVAADIHFLATDPPDTIARKALRVNLSDLAAKGAKPSAYVMSLGISEEADEAWLRSFTQGLKADQAQYGIGLLGGDTISVRRGPVVSITAFGYAPKGRMVHRFGGRPGDELFVSGTIGAGTVGLAVLRSERGPWDALPASLREAFVQRYRVPEPRTALAAAIAEFASAAMDISDGLVGDCDKLAGASRCSASIDAEQVPYPDGIAGTADSSVLARLLTGGDDYEVLAAVPPAGRQGFEAAARRAGVAVVHIGNLTDATNPPEVLFRGKPMDLKSRSYVHGGEVG